MINDGKKERMSEEEINKFLKKYPYLEKLDKNDVRKLTADLLFMMMRLACGDLKDSDDVLPLQLTRYQAAL